MCSCRLVLSVLSACHFNLHKQLSVVAHMLLTFSIQLGVFKIHLCCCVCLVPATTRSPWGTSPPLTDLLLPPCNPSEMDILVPAPGGVAQKATGLFPGLDHCTYGREGGTRGSFTRISTERLHQCACPQGGRGSRMSPIPPGAGLTFAEVTCATITGVTITPADVSREPPSPHHPTGLTRHKACAFLSPLTTEEINVWKG